MTTEAPDRERTTIMSLMRNFGATTHTLGADSDATADVIDPGDGPDGEPISGEVGVRPSTQTLDPKVMAPGQRPAVTAEPNAVVALEQPSKMNCRTRVLAAGVPALMSEATPLRMTLELAAIQNSGIRIGGSAAEAMSHPSSVAIDMVGVLTHTNEVWAYVATGTPEVQLVEEMRSFIPRSFV